MDWHARFTQQARWTEHIRRYLFQRLGLAPGQRVLEVGCGTGAILSTLSQTGCQLHGLDLDHDFLLQARQNLSPLTPNFLTPDSLTQGDAHFLPYPASTFDIVCCHFLLLWVADPAGVLSEMRRVCRPGGWLLDLAEPDYGGRIDYPEALAELGARQEAALRRQGAETRLGRRLSALFHAASLQDIETGLLGGQWSAAPSTADLAREWEVLQADLADSILPEELARLRRLDTQAWALGQRVLFVPTFYAAGRK